MKYLFIILLCCVSQVIFGQQKRQSINLAHKASDRASGYIRQQLYEEAIEQLNHAVYFDSTYLSAYQQLGDIYRKLGAYPLAKKNYEKVLKINPDFLPLTYFGLAESEFNTGDYANALQHFTKYVSYPILDAGKKICAKYMLDCEFSLRAIKNPVSFNPLNMGSAVNTADDEYFPSVTADGATMIFTRRSGHGENFYTSTQKAGKWTQAKFLNDTINTDFNEGAQCISQDGMYLFFTGCNRPDGLGRCDIYISNREGESAWSEPFNIGKPVNTQAWESQPSLSANGRTLYFSSNRSGGMGGYDIWKSDIQENDSWSVPVNLGPSINTPYDEQAPFIHPDDQTLYFSSNGWPGLGKKDLFISRVNAQGQWSKPTNLGYPINTFNEENGLTVSRDGKAAYFSADREGTFGKLDIYSFELPESIRPYPVTYVRGIIIDEDTKKPLNAKIQMHDLTSGKFVFDDVCDTDSGGFLATMRVGRSFSLAVSKEGYLLHSENFTLKDEKSNEPFNVKIVLQKIEVGRKTTLNNIFFDTNKYDLLPESRIELQEVIAFLTDNPRVGIEIQGYTDDRGSEALNRILSENRAKAVYNYLVYSGVKPNVLSYRGYGASNPIADNATEEGKRMNRRTQFQITKK